MSQLISANNLTHSFASRTLFSKVSLGVFEKDRIGLVGPNGAGKSTLMKILARTITPDQGQVTWRRGLQVGFLAQTPHFQKDETIYDAIVSKALDPIEASASAYEWISKFNLDQFDIFMPVEKLSGGWKKRVALARELVLAPEILLLDEPTNHLDVEGILWLEDFLESAGGSSGRSGLAVMTITHDRLFLQRVATKIFDLDPKNPTNLLVVEGSYTQYLEEKELLVQGQKHREWTLKNTLRRETEWLRRGAKARLTKQKARIDRAYDLKDDVQELAQKNRVRKVTIDFGETDRAPKKLIEAQSISKKFENGEVLFKDFTTIVSPKTRMGLLGPNGAGKSTLIKVLLGREAVSSGSLQLAEEVKISYFEQNRETLDPKKSLLKNICDEGDYVNFMGKYVFARSYLERFLFSTQQMDLPVERLSGGEQSRLRIAQMMLTPANVLVLDEPTNDLDVETLTVLEESLKEFPGAVILVTHDRYFMDQVATEILAFAKDENGDGKIERFADYFQWESWKTEQEMTASSPAPVKKVETAPAPAAPSAPVKARKLSNKERIELEGMESNILALETSISALETEAASPEVIANATKLQEIYQKLGDQQKKLETMYARWAELEKPAT